MSEELIAENEGKSGGEGGGIALDVYNMGSDLFNDSSDWEKGIDTALVGIDLLSNAANPLGGLIAAGVGWLLEHIPGISDVWDDLMGDAAAIEQIAGTWDNISRALNTCDIDFSRASQQIEGWSGKAKQSYIDVAKAYEASTHGTSVESEALSVVVRLIGGICSGLKDVVYMLIAEFIEFTVLPAILSAIATSWCTFGGSIAAAITYIEIQADITAEQITVKITHVTEEIVVISERAAKIISKLDGMKAALKELDEGFKFGEELGKGVAHGETESAGGLGPKEGE